MFFHFRQVRYSFKGRKIPLLVMQLFTPWWMVSIEPVARPLVVGTALFSAQGSVRRIYSAPPPRFAQRGKFVAVRPRELSDLYRLWGG